MKIVWRILLHLHSREFRRARGPEVLDFVDRALIEARTCGLGTVLTTWARLFFDLLRSAARSRRFAAIDSSDPITHPRTGRTMSWHQDLRYAGRSLFGSPFVTLLVIATLGVGVGMNTAIFSVVNGVLLRPLDYRNPNELVEIHGRLAAQEGSPPMPLSIVGIDEIEARVDGIEVVAPFVEIRQNLTGAGLPRQVAVGWTDHRLLSVLGVEPALGRSFIEDDPSGLVILSDRIWREQFGADPNVLETAVRLDGSAYTVVGVLPPRFQLHLPGYSDIELWKNPDALWQNGDVWGTNDLGAAFFNAIGRLSADADRDLVARELNTVAEDFRTRYSDYERERLELTFVPMRERLVQNVRTSLLLLSGAVGLVLLIACANVASLLLVRAQSRTREMVLRLALGASRWRLARLLLFESLILASLAGAAGVLIGALGTRMLEWAGPTIPRSESISVDPEVLGFALLVSLGCTLLVGLAPALRVTRNDGATVLRSERGHVGEGRRIRGFLVVTQIAVSLVLLIGAGLLTHSLAKLQSVEAGFDSEGVLTFAVSLPGTKYPWPSGTDRFFREFESRLEAETEIREAGVMWPIPLKGQMWFSPFDVQPRDGDQEVYADYHVGTEGYFEAMGIPVEAGRTFEGSDPRQVVVVNRALADRFWPGESALGRTLRADPWASGPSEFQVIGVVADSRLQDLRQSEVRPALFFDTRGWSWTDWEFFVVARVEGNPEAVVPEVRALLASMDSEIPMADVMSMERVVDDALAPTRFALGLMGLFSLVAVGLTVVGLYGVVSYSVGRRTSEIGIRMALGSQRSEVTRLVVTEGLRLAAIGIGVGLAGAYFVTQLLTSYLFEVTPTDPITFVTLASLMGGLAVLASWIPARRASHIDPVHALRSE